MACDDLGGRWLRVMLVKDTTDEVQADNDMEIFRLGPGRLEAEFLNSGEGRRYPVTCTPINADRARIEITRRHADGITTTTYRGVAVRFTSRGFVIVRGRYARITASVNRETSAVNLNLIEFGDWETEKPT